MNEVGQKIRTLRKERKLTLDALAGERLSKGMLSLIENGKAQPSMESLHYIASRLEVDVSELLQERRIKHIEEILIKAEKLADRYAKSYYDEQYRLEFMEFIKPIYPQLRKTSYEEIRLLDIYYRVSAGSELQVNDEDYLELAKLYRDVHAYEKMMNSYNIISWKYFYTKNYAKSMVFLQMAEQQLESFPWLINDISRLDLYYNFMVIATSMFDMETTAKYYEKALDIAKEKRIYYRIDDIYRMQFALKIVDEQFEEAKFFLNKLMAMAQFADDTVTDGWSAYCQVHYINNVEHHYEQVLTMISAMEEQAKEKGLGIESNIFNIERAFALYGLERYEEALQVAQPIIVPAYINHPLDIGLFYCNSAIRAVCYAKVGNAEEAKRDIYYAMEGIKSYKHKFYKKRIEQAYEQVKKHIPSL